MPPERVHQELVLVERGLFQLGDDAAVETSMPGDEGRPLGQGGTVAVSRGRVLLASAVPDHLVAVRLEAWSARPPAPSVPSGASESTAAAPVAQGPSPRAGDAEGRDGWDDDEEVSVELPSGRIRLGTLTAGWQEYEFVCGPPGTYGLRVWCTGRDEVLLLAHAGRPVPDGTERYVLQWWPRSDGWT